MDQIRNFAQTNRSSIVNIIYIVAAVILVYYLVMYYFNTEQMDKVLLKNKTATNVFAGNADLNSHIVAEKDATKYRAGSEYTISFWMYISNFASTGANFQNILAFLDQGKITTSGGEPLIYVGLHPTQPKLAVRAGCIKGKQLSGPGAFTVDANKNIMFTAAEPGTSDAFPVCDVMDIDIQRWMCITISVNGRILDVYMDGKLARSCILENIQEPTNDVQSLALMPAFNGYLSGVMYSNYAVAPDVIYGRYQAGPYYSSSFIDYLVDKLGIRITYTGTTGGENTKSLLETLGVKV